MAAITRDGARAEAALEPVTQGAQVWPRLETSERVNTDRRGRVKTQRQWRIMLANAGNEPARNVRFRLEAENEGENLPHLHDSDRRWKRWLLEPKFLTKSASTCVLRLRRGAPVRGTTPPAHMKTRLRFGFIAGLRCAEGHRGYPARPPATSASSNPGKDLGDDP
jgi:hypothetical protein